MNATRQVVFALWLLIVANPMGVTFADEADRIASTIAPFIDEETYAVAHANVSTADLPALIRRFGPQLGVDPASVRQTALAAEGFKSGMKLAFGQSDDRIDTEPIEVFVVLSTRYNLLEGPGIVVIPLHGSANAAMIRRAAEPVVDMGSTARIHGCLVFASPDALEQARSITPDARPTLAQQFRSVEPADVRLVLTPPPFMRKVLRDLMPTMPEQLGGGSSTVLTEGLVWGAAGARIGDDAAVCAVVQSGNQEVAARLREVIARTLELAWQEQREVREFITRERFEQIVRSVMPEQRVERLMTTLSTSRLEQMADLIRDSIQRVSEGAPRADYE